MENKSASDDYRSRQYPVQEHMAFQRLAWTLQRWGTFLLFLFVLLAALGLFSQGLMSDASRQSSSGNLKLEYDRFARNTTDTHYVIHVRINKENAMQIKLTGNIINNFDIEYIQPQPQSASLNNNTLTLTQSIPEKDQWYSMYITLKPNKMGYFTNTIMTSGTEKITFNQLVYP
ncbi:hypothetical protein Sant_0986 [Sodalis praecaptivus]|uniref:Uncharacterized protein n=1 Tax=Sodalis praecaptivus TaxID=1239307 RepID=W0HV37_9GAMM|nr:hypothetical protein [Sodalis praecaptivus]AHF76060.1 hypothetical protein Sant_0986 [Sodalis praecaptivus]